MTHVTQTREDTQSLGMQLAATLKRGDVVLLTGDMGAGKSEFSRGVARGLGITCAVPSPSFTILNVYEEGSLPLYHFDWYRLESAEELFELGMDEYLGGDGVAVVEWPSQCPEAIPETHLAVHLTPVGDSEREITIQPMGDFRDITFD